MMFFAPALIAPWMMSFVSFARSAGIVGSRSTPSYLMTSPEMLDARTSGLISCVFVLVEEPELDVAAGFGVGVVVLSVDGL